MRTTLLTLALSALLIGATDRTALAQKLDELYRQQAASAKKVYDGRWEECQAGKTVVEEVYIWSRRLMEADRKAGKRGVELDHWQRMVKLDELITPKFEAGQISATQGESVRYYRIEAQVWVTEAAKNKK